MKRNNMSLVLPLKLTVVLPSVVSAAALSAQLFVLPAYAQQSPDFAYTAEQWAGYRDNVLTFDEIPVLIHEYNPTVLKNAIDYKDQSDKSSTDIANSYYDSAEQIYNNMAYPDDESANYASALSAYLNAQITYENMMEQGDNNTNDNETYRLNYERQEANLVRQAKQQMVSYWNQYYSLDNYRRQIITAQNNLTAAEHKLAAGTGTASAKLQAEQALTSAQTALTTAETGLKTTKENLCLMMGWSAGADVDIQPVPEISAESIAAIDLNADISAAKANNYTLRSLERQLGNAQTASVKDQLTVTRDTAVRNIENNVTNLHQSLLQSLTELNASIETLSVRNADLAAAGRKKAAGMMTDRDYAAAETAYQSAEVQARQKKLSLLNAWISYESAVQGLATTE